MQIFHNSGQILNHKTSRNTKGAILLLLMLLAPLAAFSVLPFADAASGSFTMTPTTFTYSGGILSTTAYATGGTFSSSATVRFYVSADTLFTTKDLVGTIGTIGAGQTTIAANTPVTISGGGAVVTAAGTYYVAASDDVGVTFTTPVAITVTTQAITLTAGATVVPTPTAKVAFSGTGYTAATSVSIYLTAPGYAVGGTLLTTATATATGIISGTFNAPSVVGGTYSVYAVASSGLTVASAPLIIIAGITVSTIDIGTAAGQAVSINGYGYTSAASFLANTITVGSPTTHAAVTVLSTGTGTFSVVATTTAVQGSTGFVPVVVPSSTTTGYVLVSTPGLTASSAQILTSGGGASSATVNVADSQTICVFNYPAYVSLSVIMGSNSLGTIVTDGNGAGSVAVTIPSLPAGAYVINPTSSNGIAATNVLTLTVASSLTATSTATTWPVITSAATVTLTGKGFAAESTLTITSTALTPSSTTVTSDGTGSFSKGVKFTGTYTTGNTFTVSVAGTTALVGITTPTNTLITWEGTAALTVTPTNGIVGSTVTVGGSNLVPGSTYTVQFAGSTITVGGNALTFIAGSNGAVPGGVTFAVPIIAQGIYTVAISGTPSVSTSFIVSTPSSVTPTMQAAVIAGTPPVAGTPSATSLSFTPTSSAITGTMSVYLYGWAPSETVTISMVGVGILTAQVVDSSGSLIITPVTVPARTGGTYQIYATGTTSTVGTSGTPMTITVNSVFTIDSSSGNPGATVTVTKGLALAANTAYDITFGGQDVAYAGTTTAVGALTTTPFTFTVPLNATKGATTVGLVLSATPTATPVKTQPFTVSNAVISTTSAGAGQSVPFNWLVAGLTAPVYVTVKLNGTAIQNAQAAYSGSVLSGSFNMPTGVAAGTVYSVTLSYIDSATTTVTVAAPASQTFTSGTATDTFVLAGVTSTNLVVGSIKAQCLDVPGYPEGISTIVAGTTSTTVVTSTPIYSVVFGYSTYATFTKSSSASGNFAPSPAVYITVAADTLTGLVNMIEAKLDAGGTFYNFVAGRFTAICNTLGTFLGTDTVASLLYNIKANTDTINSKVSMPDVLKFDFGGPQAAFQPDYIHITNATAYSADLGYGWASATGMSYRDRGTANYAETGLVFSNASETFRVDLPNGNYTVAVTQGDAAWAHDGMTITAGSYTATVSNVAGGYTQTVFTACVTGGNLQITLGKATGATDPNWVLNGIVIYKSWNK